MNERSEVKGVFERLFSTADGRVALDAILRMGGVASVTFGERWKVEFNEGRRSLALEIATLASPSRDAVRSVALDLLRQQQQPERRMELDEDD